MAKELEFAPDDRALALSLFDRGLPPLATTACLPYLFGISAKLVGAMEERPRNFYRQFELRKKDGTGRAIFAPRRFLKLIQRWLMEHVLTPQPLGSHVTGFRRGVSVFTNASQHVRRRNVLSVDISDFFPSVKRAQVRQIYYELGFPQPVARQLSGLCTLDGRLPQGAPSSPALANLIFRPCDSALAELASSWSAAYTRYADDLTFSRDARFGHEEISAVSQIVQQFGFTLNADKTRVAGPGQRKTVTGLVVNQHPKPPRSTRRLWRVMFDRAERHPAEFAARTDVLAGIASFVNQYDSARAREYRRVALLVEGVAPKKQRER